MRRHPQVERSYPSKSPIRRDLASAPGAGLDRRRQLGRYFFGIAATSSGVSLVSLRAIRGTLKPEPLAKPTPWVLKPEPPLSWATDSCRSIAEQIELDPRTAEMRWTAGHISSGEPALK